MSPSIIGADNLAGESPERVGLRGAGVGDDNGAAGVAAVLGLDVVGQLAEKLGADR